jgi:N-acetylglutamate synthase/N-acetylornithine aminotransferase
MTAQALNLPEEQIMISSIGVIGQYMPMEKVADGIRQLAGQLTPKETATPRGDHDNRYVPKEQLSGFR